MTDPKQPSWKEKVDASTSAAGLIAKVAVGFGIIFACSYLFRIRFFPQGLSLSETMLFVFAALSIVFLTGVTLIYSAYALVWVNLTLTLLIWLPSRPTCRASMSSRAALRAKKQDRSKGIRKQLDGWRRSWRSFQRVSGAARRNEKYLVPDSLKGTLSLAFSAVVFLIFVLALWPHDTGAVRDFVYACAMSGFVLLTFGAFADHQQRKPNPKTSLSHMQIRAVGVGTSLLVLFTFGGFGPLSDLAFERMGIKSAGDTIEIEVDELSSLKRISREMGFPVYSCRIATKDRILLHHAEVLWSQVGTKSLLRFSAAPSNERKPVAGSEVNQSRLPLPAEAIRMSSLSLGHSACYPYQMSDLFIAGSDDLSPLGQKLMSRLASIVVVDSSAPQIAIAINQSTVDIGPNRFDRDLFWAGRLQQHLAKLTQQKVALVSLHDHGDASAFNDMAQPKDGELQVRFQYE